MHIGDVVPDGEAEGHLEAVAGGGHQAAWGPEVGSDAAERGQVFGPRTARVPTVRGPAVAGEELTLATTDLASTAAALVARYAGRWSIETAVFDGKQFVGAGQARNRTRAAVERTVPFVMVRTGLIPPWYSQFGDPAADVAHRRRTAPWSTTKKDPSFEDMLAALRRVIIAARFTPPRADAPTPAEIPRAQQAWAAAAA
jgi:hypothetical protein